MSRCPECRKPITDGQPTVSRQGVAGTRAGLVHRQVTNVWHESCWADVERFGQESRARAEEDRRSTIREMALALGLPEPSFKD